MKYLSLSLLFLCQTVSLWGWTHVGSNIRGWSGATVTFGVNTTGCTLPEATVLDLVDQAIAAWNGVPSSGLKVARRTSATTVATFLAGSATDAPVILCDTTFSNEIGADVQVVPAATFNTGVNSSGTLVYSGILLNAQTGAAADIAQLSSGQVALTLAHEMGHALGLGHSSQAEALMYYSLGDKSRALLTEDDIAGVTQLYPRNEFKTGQLGCAAVRGRQTSAEKISGLLLTMVFSAVIVITVLFGRYAINDKSTYLVKPERLP